MILQACLPIYMLASPKEFSVLGFDLEGDTPNISLYRAGAHGVHVKVMRNRNMWKVYNSNICSETAWHESRPNDMLIRVFLSTLQYFPVASLDYTFSWREIVVQRTGV